MANLTGNLRDVTNQAPSTVVSITVKAPGVRLGTGSDLIVSSPAEVDFNHDTGVLTLTGITGGLSWLVIEGNGWSDTVSLAVADGMTTLVEAVANASGVPGMVDFVRLLEALENAVADVAQDAVDEAADQYVRVSNLDTRHLDEVVTPGRYAQVLTSNATIAQGYPVENTRVNLFVYRMNENAASQVMQTLINKNNGDVYTRDFITVWSDWRKAGTGVVNLGDRHLDDVKTPNLYSQPLVNSVVESKGYPFTGSRCSLFVYRMNENAASQVMQTLINKNNGDVYTRDWNGVWSDWRKAGTGVVNLGDRHLDDVKLAGNYTQVFKDKVTVAKGYPIAGERVVVDVKHINENDRRQVLQTVTTLDGATHTRYWNWQWSPWVSGSEGAGTVVVPGGLTGDLFTVDTNGLDIEFVAPEQSQDTVFPNTNADGVHALYDALVNGHPDYISRRTIGTSSDGVTPMYAYTFKPTEVPADNTGEVNSSLTREYPTAVIMSGTHGHEVASVANIYRFAKMLCDDWEEYPALEAIRWNCEVIIVPMVNAYGWNGRGDSQVWSRKNANEVDINRNFPREWKLTTPGTATWGGEAPLTEPETQALWALFEEVKDRAVFGIDSHNFSSNETSAWRQIWDIYTDTMTMEVGRAVVKSLSRRWKSQYSWITVPETYLGYVEEGAGGTVAKGMLDKGISASTLETNNLTFLDGGTGEDYSARAMTLGLDTVVNHIRLAFREGIRRKPAVGGNS